MTKQNVKVNDEQGQMNVEHDYAKATNTNLGGEGECVHKSIHHNVLKKRAKLHCFQQ
jgi:hypothetical protein